VNQEDNSLLIDGDEPEGEQKYVMKLGFRSIYERNLASDALKKQVVMVGEYLKVVHMLLQKKYHLILIILSNYWWWNMEIK